MSVAEIGQLHGRYVRLSDKFKSIWTYNQFAAGVYKNILQLPLPYKIDFQKVYDTIRVAGDAIQSNVGSASAAPLLESCEIELQPIVTELAAADELITASILRRFFEKLRRQDDKIIFNLIKFYLYADAVRNDQRDKLDFLFTRIGEDFVEERGDYALKDSQELRKMLHGLTSVRSCGPSSPEDVFNLVKTLRALKKEIQEATAIEELTSKKLLTNVRNLKHNIGDMFFDNDVLLAIIDCNIVTKNVFIHLYKNEEEKIIEDSRKLLESEQSITSSMSQNNPNFADEMERFKNFKQQFDDSRARSDLKHHLITQLKLSMNQLLSQMDQAFEDPTQWADSDMLLYPEEVDEVQAKFGDDPQLHGYLVKVVSILNYFDPDVSQDHIIRSPEAKGLRLETWEIDAFQKLYWGRQLSKDDSDDLLLLYLRAAAMRLKIEDEAQSLLTQPKDKKSDPLLLEKVGATLERAKDLDTRFNEFLDGGPFGLSSKTTHRLYRSRLRLMRSFSGLWLLYDQHAALEERIERFR
ncbi:MAG TPA: hypothetical protein VHL58_05345 [Thermoanaerobaculia bacterium]|nr:hypothetical protein [Thermoanaerobaculia bacterium]